MLTSNAHASLGSLRTTVERYVKRSGSRSSCLTFLMNRTEVTRLRDLGFKVSRCSNRSIRRFDATLQKQHASVVIPCEDLCYQVGMMCYKGKDGDLAKNYLGRRRTTLCFVLNSKSRVPPSLLITQNTLRVTYCSWPHACSRSV